MLAGTRLVNCRRLNTREVEPVEIGGLPEIARTCADIIDHIRIAPLKYSHSRMQIWPEPGIHAPLVAGGALGFEIWIAPVGGIAVIEIRITRQPERAAGRCSDLDTRRQPCRAA